MKRSRRKGRMRHVYLRLIIAAIGTAVFVVVICIMGTLAIKSKWKTPQELLLQYMDYIPNQEYEKMYAMLDTDALGSISQEDFIKRNSAIYEGIELQNMTVEILEYDEEHRLVTYQTSFDTVAGNIQFENEALFVEGKDEYKLVWDDSIIFPNLSYSDKVRVSTIQAERGEILDRNGRVLAGKGTASSVGIVPGKIENRTEQSQRLQNYWKSHLK